MKIMLDMASFVCDCALFVYLLKYLFDDEIKITSILWLSMAVVGGMAALLSRFWDLYGILFLFLFLLGVQIFFSRGKIMRALGNLFVCFQLLLIPLEIISVFFGTIGQIGFLTGDTFPLFGCVLDLVAIFFISKKLKNKNIHVRFGNAELLLLISINVVSILIVLALTYFNLYMKNIGFAVKLFAVLLGFSSILLDVFFGLYLIKNKIVTYYKLQNERDRYYMGEQLKYFQAYHETQEELRRFRHDMKNHILCLSSFSSHHQYSELEAYVINLGEQWEKIPQLYTLGNPIVDAVVNSKTFLFQKQCIHFTTDGGFTTELTMDPVDLCCIFSNAVDNAIEANEKILNDSSRYLKITIKNNDRFYLVTFENPLATAIDRNGKQLFTTKADEKNHGFGLTNMAIAVKKYGGYIDINTDGQLFCLDVAIPR